jgi:predicted PurR-regulated permease PerM
MAETRQPAGVLGPPAPDERDRMSPAALYRAVLLAFGLVVLVLIFPTLAGLLLLVLLIVIVAVPMSAATAWLNRHLRLPRAVAAPIVLLAALGVIAAIITLLVPVFVDEGNRLVKSLPSIVDDVRKELGRGPVQPGQAGHDIQNWVNGYTQHPAKLLGPATTVGAGIAGLFTTIIVTLLTALYTAIQPEPLLRGAVRLVAPPRREQARRIMRKLSRAYLGWLRGLIVGMAVLWVITYVGLLAIGLPYAVLFATLTALAMVVPYYGALVSAVPPIVLALTISPGKALLVVGLYLLSHQIEGNIIEPIVMARAVHLHPALVALGVIAVERMFGFAGLLVAVPILVTFKIFVEELWVRPMEVAYLGREPPDEEPHLREGRAEGDGGRRGFARLGRRERERPPAAVVKASEAPALPDTGQHGSTG